MRWAIDRNRVGSPDHGFQIRSIRSSHREGAKFSSLFILLPCYRRAIPVKALMRGLGLMFLSAILLGLTGCGTDNESEAEKLQKGTGPPPPVPEGSQPTSTPKISTREDYGKNYKNPLEGTKYSPGRRK